MKTMILVMTLLFAPLASFAQAQSAVSLEAQGRDQYYNYSFGSVFENTRAYADFTLTARGDAPLEVRRILISGIMYDAYSNCPQILAPMQTCTIRAFYWPRSRGPHWGELTLMLNEGNIYIRLFGDTFPR